MSLATRAATCTACGKRLTRKQWYYRNGQYFCKKRCWLTHRESAAAAPATPKGAPAPAAPGSAEEPPAPAAPAEPPAG